MQHQLSLKFDDNLTLSSLTIRDISTYVSSAAITNPVLEVFPPDSVASALFSDIIAPGWVKIITLTDLHLNSGGVYPLPAIPDGNYYVRYSVAPNLRIFVDYNYYRTAKLLTKFFAISWEFLNNKSTFTSSFYRSRLQDLLWYKHCIDIAKFSAEDKHDIVMADRIYKEIDDTLDKFNMCQGC